jgi:hypothetical protein
MIMRENNGKIVSMGTGLSKHRHNEHCPLLFFNRKSPCSPSNKVNKKKKEKGEQGDFRLKK